MAQVHNVNQKCCATCRFWGGDGSRGLDFRNNKPFYVRVIGSIAPCMAKAGGSSPSSCCSKWQKWEKLG